MERIPTVISPRGYDVKVKSYQDSQSQEEKVKSHDYHHLALDNKVDRKIVPVYD